MTCTCIFSKKILTIYFLASKSKVTLTVLVIKLDYFLKVLPFQLKLPNKEYIPTKLEKNG